MANSSSAFDVNDYFKITELLLEHSFFIKIWCYGSWFGRELFSIINKYLYLFVGNSTFILYLFYLKIIVF